MNAKRWTHGVVRLVGGVVVLGLAVAMAAPPAFAAGNAALDAHIIPDPISGGSPIPASVLSAYVTHLQGIESAAVAGIPGASITMAAQGWQRTSSKGILISLIAIQQNGLSTSETHAQALGGAKAASESYCEGATGNEPFLDRPVASIPNSHFAVCTPYKGHIAVAITSARANVLMLIETSSKAFTNTQLEAIALRQYDALSTTDVATSSGDTTAVVIGSIVGGVVIIGLVVGVVLILRHDRRRQRRHAPSPGWYVNVSEPGPQRYWTGRGWQPLPLVDVSPPPMPPAAPPGPLPSPPSWSPLPPPGAGATPLAPPVGGLDDVSPAPSPEEPPT